jgi:hypothetical protein
LIRYPLSFVSFFYDSVLISCQQIPIKDVLKNSESSKSCLNPQGTLAVGFQKNYLMLDGTYTRLVQCWPIFCRVLLLHLTLLSFKLCKLPSRDKALKKVLPILDSKAHGDENFKSRHLSLGHSAPITCTSFFSLDPVSLVHMNLKSGKCTVVTSLCIKEARMQQSCSFS